MFVTLFTCLGGAAFATAAMLEASVHRNGRRGTAQPVVAGVQHAVDEQLGGHNAQLFSLAGYRAVYRSGVADETLPEGHLAEVVQLDFRREFGTQATRLRARA